MHPVASTVQVLSTLAFSLWSGVTLALVLLWLFPWKRLLDRLAPPTWIEAWSHSCRFYAESPRALAGCLALSIVSSALTAASFAAANHVFGGEVTYATSLLVGPSIVLANCLPITPGGVGVAEAASSELFLRFGTTDGAEMMLAIRLAMALISLPALLALLGGRRRRISSTPRPTEASTRKVAAPDSHSGSSRAA
jgi:uncharacterized membrane protein YbhN (UPF0104 family)